MIKITPPKNKTKSPARCRYQWDHEMCLMLMLSVTDMGRRNSYPANISKIPERWEMIYSGDSPGSTGKDKMKARGTFLYPVPWTESNVITGNKYCLSRQGHNESRTSMATRYHMWHCKSVPSKRRSRSEEIRGTPESGKACSHAKGPLHHSCHLWWPFGFWCTLEQEAKFKVWCIALGPDTDCILFQRVIYIFFDIFCSQMMRGCGSQRGNSKE